MEVSPHFIREDLPILAGTLYSLSSSLLHILEVKTKCFVSTSGMKIHGWSGYSQRLQTICAPPQLMHIEQEPTSSIEPGQAATPPAQQD